jgi:diaminohydroxyphosphoribosylaminopyrimidine deaminase/5-amino-6-(5-phosphoribosylamino)uracil reductase
MIERLTAQAADPCAWLASSGRFVLGQLAQSLDGRIATASGDSFYVSCPEALAHLHRLRAHVDAVVIGVGTLCADDPRLTVRLVPGRNPARVVIDPRGRMPATARLLHDDAAPVWVVGPTAPPGARAIDLPAPGGRFDPHAIVAALAARGLHRLLIEGGGHTVSSFLAASALDRLHVVVAPLLIGSGSFGLQLPPVERLADALRPAACIHRLGTDLLFDLDLRGDG